MRDDIHKELNKKLHWLLISRFALFIVVFGAVLISQPQDSYIYYLLLLYGSSTAGYLIALFRKPKEKPYMSFRFLCSIPLAIEILVEIVLIHMTGGVQSPYIFLIALSIITAAFIYKLSGTLIVTALSSVLYSLMVFFQYKDYIEFDKTSPGLSAIYSNPDALFFSVYIFVCFLFIIAFLAGYLSRKLHLQVEKIRTLDTEISHLKLSTGEIMEHLTNGVLVVDKNGEITYFNNTAQEILDIDWRSVKNKNLREILQQRLPDIYEMIEHFIKSGNMKSFKREITLKKTIPQRINLKVAVNSLDVGGQSHGTVIVLEDITNEKKRKMLMEQMEKLAAIGDLSARFAHEIRNPLASIRGSVEMLMGNINLPPEDKRLFELVIRESDRLTNLLEDFLAFARLKEIPAEQFQMGKVDVGLMVEEIVMLLKTHPAYNEKIEIESKIVPSEILVKGQDEQLSKAFNNIILNSLQALPREGGKIIIDVLSTRQDIFEDQQMVGFVIEDNGCGIDENELNNIFTPFYSNKRFGSGLGMPIANSVISKHNGYIDIESKIGKGTKVFIYLHKITNEKDFLSQQIV